MATVLVYIEVTNGRIAKASLAALTAASKLGGDLVAYASAEANELSTLPVKKVSVAVPATPVAELIAEGLLAAADASGADTVVLAATALGKGVAPRVAAKRDAAQLSDIIGVNSDGTFTRPMYAGDAIATVRATGTKRVITVRASAFDAMSTTGSPAVEKLAVSFSSPRVGIISFEGAGGSRPQLGESMVVVSGGRALGSKEKFDALVLPLADALKAAVGASRAAVDSGYAPNDWQVGQTGKIVAPELYIAVGISGAIQHLAGMKDSKVIVAINKDPDAPIFEIADYGLVADLFATVPELTAALKSMHGT